MFISNEEYKKIEIQSIDEPSSIEWFWILDLIEQDFMLTKLVLFEEFVAPSLTLSIGGVDGAGGATIQLPAEWNILVYSPETSDVDMVAISDLTKSNFSIFLYDHKRNAVIDKETRVVAYSPSSVVRTPVFNKSNMLCHPIGTQHWVFVAPTDTYTKYLKQSATVGNFLY